MNAIIGLNSLALEDAGFSQATRDHLQKIGTSAQCRDKKIRYSCNVKDGVSNCYIGDEMKLRQVLINILGNAVKFTPEGGSVSLVVEALAIDGGKCPLRFTVEDSGIGIGKDFLPRMFDAFTLEDESYTSKHGSTGLGLSITKSIVELMDGHIAVEMFKSHEPGYYSAILMDVRMPEMDGLEATRVIRSMDREDAKSIPIIALTANAFDEDVQNSLQAGLNAHLNKPVEPETVFRTLEELL